MINGCSKMLILSFTNSTPEKCITSNRLHSENFFINRRKEIYIIMKSWDEVIWLDDNLIFKDGNRCTVFMLACTAKLKYMYYRLSFYLPWAACLLSWWAITRTCLMVATQNTGIWLLSGDDMAVVTSYKPIPKTKQILDNPINTGPLR